MRRLLLLAAFVASTSHAQAANQASLSWSAPTTYSDGSPLTGTLTYTVYQGPQGGTKAKVSSTATTTYTVSSGLTQGTTVCWQVSATLNGQESALSNEA